VWFDASARFSSTRRASTAPGPTGWASHDTRSPPRWARSSPRGEDYRQVFQHFRPGFDLAKEHQARLDAGLGEYLNADDLYPDVRPCLRALKEAGYFVRIAGNQTTRAGHFIRELNLPADVIAASDEWGVTKPTPAFFAKLIEVSRHLSSVVDLKVRSHPLEVGWCRRIARLQRMNPDGPRRTHTVNMPAAAAGAMSLSSRSPT
jgi:hypothetical protein